MKPATVYIFDSHVVIRQGLRHILEASGRLSVTGDSDTVTDMMEHLHLQKADVYVIGLTQVDGRGIGLLQEIRYKFPTVRLVIYSDIDNIPMVSRAYKRGVRAFLSKSSTEELLINTLCAVAQGEIVFAPGIAEKLAVHHTSGEGEQDPRSALNDKELVVFKMLAEGKPIPKIAQELALSEKTVRNRAITIKHKLDIDRHRFTEVAVAHQLIAPPPVEQRGD